MVEPDRYCWTKSLRNLPEITYDDVVGTVNEHSQSKKHFENGKKGKRYKTMYRNHQGLQW